ncbi:MAG: prepilin peptidase [Promethearchaeota archaeon]
MLPLILIIDFISITTIFLISLFFDLKFRRIPNRALKIFFLLGLILNFLEFSVFYKKFLLFLILKILIFFFIFLISMILFSLRIIGGGDGKLIILVFIIHPIKYLNFDFVISFFLLFSLFFLTLFILNFLFNYIVNNCYSFDILFNLDLNINSLKRLYFKMFFRFFNLSEIKKFQGYKKLLKSQAILYNYIKKKFQLFVQYRPPLVFICMLAYYSVVFLKIVI